MAEDDDYDDSDPSLEGGRFHWMSALVVLLAVAGFFGLAWYAYKNGGENVDEKDVELIKADTTPVKEAPANPGGMQIPNQDKTVYGLISGKTEKPVVERILPAPEEPIARTGDTETWMSDSAKGKTGTEEAPETKPAPPAADADKPKEQFNPAKIRAAKPEAQMAAAAPVTPVTVTPTPTPAPATPALAPQAKPKPPITPPAPPASAPKPAPVAANAAKHEDEKPAPKAQSETKPPEKAPTGVRVQLGSYRSQAEAESNWSRIAKKFPDDLDGKQHYVARADLGSKGVYYRLQVAPFPSSSDAEQFCLDFVSSGQGCIVAKGK